MDVNEAVRWKRRHIEVTGEGAVPSDEAVLKVGDGVAVGVFDDRNGRVCGDSFPAEGVV